MSWLDNYFCPENCKDLSVTEEEQNKQKIKEKHKCKKYKSIVYHGGRHPLYIGALNVSKKMS